MSFVADESICIKQYRVDHVDRSRRQSSPKICFRCNDLPAAFTPT